jgi:hypothetical protein
MAYIPFICSLDSRLTHYQSDFTMILDSTLICASIIIAELIRVIFLLWTNLGYFIKFIFCSLLPELCVLWVSGNEIVS